MMNYSSKRIAFEAPENVDAQHNITINDNESTGNKLFEYFDFTRYSVVT